MQPPTSLKTFTSGDDRGQEGSLRPNTLEDLGQPKTSDHQGPNTPGLMDVDVVRQPDRLSFRAQPGLSPPSLGRIPEPVRPQHLFLCVKVWLSVSA